ncbi:acyl carrier protein [Myroides marinus]|uniref:acyl carrier protein n=1 Tax=Myroides marinus TaxID=703342 RepID=UPI0025768096|nr:acyl carrier protein [Myroides marinus]MDM1362591.1 acyl carrier protein [Myroides marinus]
MINKVDFLNIVKDQFEDSSSIQLELSDNFKELDSFDSLTGMCIMVAMKDEFDIEVTEEEFRKISTVDELYDLVIK